MSTLKRFRFLDGVDMADVQSALTVATLAAEANFGRAQLRLDADFRLDPDRRVLDCDTSRPVGECIARVFMALLTQSLGEEAFVVEEAPEGAPRAAAPQVRGNGAASRRWDFPSNRLE